MKRLKYFWQTLSERNHLAIIGIILSIFIISANLAWLNPRPDYVVKTHPRIPVLWQFNGDATVEFLSAAYFPEYFKVDKTRVNRPTYPLVANVLGQAYGLVALPFYELNPLQKGMLGYMTMKFLIYLSAAITLYHLIRRWYPKKVALLSIPLVFLHPFAVIYSGTFHTSELQIITPIFLIALWLDLAERYSHRKNILYSMLAGVLMLAKQNYAPYLAILLYSFFVAKKYKETILSVVVHFIPLLMWLVTLKAMSIPYYNHELATNANGVWILTAFVSKNFFEFVQIIVDNFKGWLLGITSYFTIFVFLSLLALSMPEVRSRFDRRLVAFFLIFAGANYLQFLAAHSLAGYLTADLAVLIYPLAAYLIYQLFERWGLKRFIPLLLVIYLLIGLTSIVNFPWVHPYDQTDITHPDRVKLLEEGKLVPRN